MAPFLRCFILGLALATSVVVDFAPEWAVVGVGMNDLKKQALESSANASAKTLVKNLTGDLYDQLIRKRVIPKISRSLLQANQRFGSSFRHKLARLWHSMLTHHLTTLEIPQAWSEAAAEVHMQLGGIGDLKQFIPAFQGKQRSINMGSGKLREEFISHAMYFLGTFVPEKITECPSESNGQALKCIAAYEDQIQTALTATLTSFFEYIVPRNPSSHIAPTSFVIAAVSPCPFGFLTEPSFIYAALKEIKFEFLTPMASIKRVSKGKPCPKLKKALLRVLMLNGVTPADMMHAKKMEDELGKFAFSSSAAVEEGADAIKEAGSTDHKKLLTKEGMDLTLSADDASEALSKLESFRETAKQRGMTLGDEAITYLAEKGSAADLGFLDRVNKFFEGDKGNAIEVEGSSLEDLIKDLAEAINEEAKKNPQQAALKPAEGKSTAEMAQEVLQKMRNFDLRTSKFVEPKADKGKKGDGTGGE